MEKLSLALFVNQRLLMLWLVNGGRLNVLLSLLNPRHLSSVSLVRDLPLKPPLISVWIPVIQSFFMEDLSVTDQTVNGIFTNVNLM
jgi:hypothetical protein